jgi:hydrogenase maturation protein HypF
VEAVQWQVGQQLNTPLTSSAGRLFDAVSALVGVRQEVTYEAQGAIELEMQATTMDTSSPVIPYPFVLTKQDDKCILGLRPLFESILEDMRHGRTAAEIGVVFHHSVAEMIVRTCEEISHETGFQTIALSGGCFQNRLLLQWTVRGLVEKGYTVLTHHQVPCNDGGLALGQAVTAGLSV